MYGIGIYTLIKLGTHLISLDCFSTVCVNMCPVCVCMCVCVPLMPIITAHKVNFNNRLSKFYLLLTGLYLSLILLMDVA